MVNAISPREGCLLGLAIGDALGHFVETKTLDEILEAYGPNGLLGYDLQSDLAEGTSYTQLAAFLCCGLLVGLTRSKPEFYSRCQNTAIREWAYCQQSRKAPDKTVCWVSRLPHFRRRLCMDTRILDALSRDRLGTPEAPMNTSSSAGAITCAVAAGLFFLPQRMDPRQVGRLGAEAVAAMCGDPETFLSGAFLAYIIAGILQEPQQSLSAQLQHAAEAVCGQFEEKFPQARNLSDRLETVFAMTKDPELSPREAMEQLGCDNGVTCLMGALYACLVHTGNFDEAMITAVNHSGRSAAVGAITGAILGAYLGSDHLPDFYLEGLEAAPALRELAEDLVLGNPTSGLFDDNWDQKYIQGMPLGL